MIIDYSNDNKYYNGINNVWLWGTRWKDCPIPPIPAICGRFWNPPDFMILDLDIGYKELDFLNRRRCRKQFRI